MTDPSGRPPIAPLTFPVRGDVVASHSCPACGADVQHQYRPGRPRVYCANACRQRAYRWRRANGVRLCVERSGPAERSLTTHKRHALRDRRDPASHVIGWRRREIAVCGAFARPARLTRTTHHDFLPDHPWSCARCAGLIGQPGDPPVE